MRPCETCDILGHLCKFPLFPRETVESERLRRHISYLASGACACCFLGQSSGRRAAFPKDVIIKIDDGEGLRDGGEGGLRWVGRGVGGVPEVWPGSLEASLQVSDWIEFSLVV